MIFLAFKGNDIHSGFAPMEDFNDHQKWVDSIVAPAWDSAGPENRIGYVIYPSGPAVQRYAAMNTTLWVRAIPSCGQYSSFFCYIEMMNDVREAYMFWSNIAMTWS